MISVQIIVLSIRVTHDVSTRLRLSYNFLHIDFLTRNDLTARQTQTAQTKLRRPMASR